MESRRQIEGFKQVKYLKKPVLVEAMQFTDANVDEFVRFVHANEGSLRLTYSVPTHGRDQVIAASVTKGTQTVQVKIDMFVLFPDGEHVHVVTKTSFLANYEEVNP